MPNNGQRVAEVTVRKAVLIPWVYLLSPRRAGAASVRAGSAGFLGAMVSCTAAFVVVSASGVVLGLQVPDTALFDNCICGTLPASSEGGIGAYVQALIENRYTMLAKLGAMLLQFECVMLAASVLLLPGLVHNDGIVAAAGRAFRVSFSAGGALTAATALLSGVWILDQGTGAASAIPTPWGALRGEISWRSAIAALCAIGFVLWWSEAAQGARRSMPGAALRPRCQECGYYLTHRPQHRCPECGEWCALSLDRDLSRPGPAWTGSPLRPLGWLEGTIDVLFAPAAFYRALPIQGRIGTARCFAGMHYALMAIGAGAAGLAVCILFQESVDRESLRFSVRLALAVPVAGWLLSRLIAIVAMMVWQLRFREIDFRAGALVFAYEAAWLWFAFAANLLLVVLWQVRESIWRWHRSLFWYFGTMAPPPAVDPLHVLWVVNAVFAIISLCRYRIAGDNLRWACH